MSTVLTDFDDNLNAKLVKRFGSLNTVSTQADIGPELILTYVLDADPSLGREYRDPVVGGVLFQQYPDLHTTMKEACASGRFGDFRKKFLSITKPNVPEPLVETPLPTVREAFNQKYYGTAVNAFYEYLKDNNRKFHSPDTNYYAKFCSIVQSSGTGKSRTMIELGKKGVVVLYMNIRDKNERTSWPQRDDIPANILSENLENLTAEDYSKRCCAFYAAIFRLLQRRLGAYRKQHGDNRAAIEHWQQLMDGSSSTKDVRNARAKFFREVEAEYDQLIESFSTEKPKATDEAKRNIDETTSKLNRLSMSDSSEAAPQQPPRVPVGDQASGTTETSPEASDKDDLSKAEREDKDLRDYESVLRESYRSLLDSLPDLFGKFSNHPKLVIAIDEAHCLSKVINNTWRPSHILCQAINTYSCMKSRKESVWVAFASTNSKIADYAAPSAIHDSLRVAVGGALLFTPFTLVGWDQGADPFSTRVLRNDDNSSFKHIVGFGRPLWSSQLKTGYEAVLELGRQKLLKEVSFKPTDLDHVLAVIGQRFCIHLCFGHPESVKYLEEGVSSHMLICHATTEDRTWRFTSYPSEPFLSHVAGDILHEKDGNVDDALKCIKKKMDSGMIEIGKTGEFASRIIWLLCKDLLLNQIHSESPPAVLYCQEVSVPKFLEMCFGENVWPKDPLQREAAQEAFKHAYVNFSHWISMTANICDEKREKWCPKTWLLRHWLRTVAVQCCHQQPLIDKVIPICFKQHKRSIFKDAKDQMSLIAASDKAGKTPNPSNVNSITRDNPSIRCVTDLPWIAVTLDMGVEKSVVESTFPTRRSPRNPQNTQAAAQGKSGAASEGEKLPDMELCLRIYASGMCVETFPFLKRPGLADTMHGIVKRATEPLNDLPEGERVSEVMKYGETSSEDHMEWEYGKQLRDGVPQ